MSQQSESYQTPPAVEPQQYEGPSKAEQRAWNFGTTTLIAAVAIIFLAIIVIYAVTR